MYSHLSFSSKFDGDRPYPILASTTTTTTDASAFAAAAAAWLFRFGATTTTTSLSTPHGQGVSRETGASSRQHTVERHILYTHRHPHHPHYAEHGEIHQEV